MIDLKWRFFSTAVLTVAALLGFAYEPQSLQATTLALFQADYDDGYVVGYDEGYDSGYATGQTQGNAYGTGDGTAQGHQDGWDVAYGPAYQASYGPAWDVGSIAGFDYGFYEGFDAGYDWATEWYKTVTNSGYALNTNVGDPNPNGTNSNVHGASISIFWNERLGGPLVEENYDWAAHYYQEGYDVGFEAGDELGNHQGYDEAYPLAFAAAYDPAFDLGQIEGGFQGNLDGVENGFTDGWDFGSDLGYDQGFDTGYAYFFEGGQRTYPIPPEPALASMTTVPEPSSLLLLGLGLVSMANLTRRLRK